MPFSVTPTVSRARFNGLGPPDEYDNTATRRRRTDRGSRRPSTAFRSGSRSALKPCDDLGRPTHRTARRGWPLSSHLDTYRYTATKLAKFIAGVKVGEASAARLDAALRQCAPLTGRSWLANPGHCCAEPSNSRFEQRPRANPCATFRRSSQRNSPRAPRRSPRSTTLRDLLAKLKASEACQKRDLTDPITL